MKRRALDLVCCPACRSALQATTPFDDTLNEGTLRCTGCGRLFPVINGIPRLLPDSLALALVIYHPEYFRAHPDVRASFERHIPSNVDERWWNAE